MERQLRQQQPLLGGLWESMRPLAVDGAGGLVGGACCVAVGHPFDTAKVLMQAQTSTNPRYPTSTAGCLMMVLKTRGLFRGWYAGAVPALYANMAENAVLFLSYGKIVQGCDRLMAREELKSNKFLVQNEPVIKGMVAGGLAAATAAATLCPTELIKCRVQAGDSGTTFQIARQIIRDQGYKGLFRGMNATMLREVPGNIAFFSMYEYSLAKFEQLEMRRDVAVLTAGGIGGISFWLVALPADAIKTRQQLFPDEGSVADSARRIIKRQGLRGFYHGLIPVVLRAFPSNAALFWGVDVTKKFLDE